MTYKGINILIVLLIIICVGEVRASNTKEASGIMSHMIFQDDTTYINSMLDRFKAAIRSDARSENTKDLFNKLNDYIIANADLSFKLRADIKRYLGAYCFYNEDYIIALDFYSEALKDYYNASKIDTKGICIVLYQIGYSNLKLDKFDSSIVYLEKSIGLREDFYGDASVQLIGPLVNITAGFIEKSDYESAREAALRGIEIIETTESNFDKLPSFYYNLGSYFSNSGDYNKALSTFKIAETGLKEYIPDDTNLLLLIYNGFGVVYKVIKDTNNAILNYEKTIDLLESTGGRIESGETYYSNYGHFLGDIGKLDKSYTVFQKAIAYCKENYGEDSDKYLGACEDLGYFFYKYAKDFDSADKIYQHLTALIKAGDYPIDLVNDVKKGRALILEEYDISGLSINLYNEILASDENFDALNLLNIYSSRSSSFRKLYQKDKDAETLQYAIDDINMAIALLDSVKIGFTGETSKLQITERFDYIWENAIWLAYESYSIDNSIERFNDALRYSEKSKASTLLASTREVQAMEFHVPGELVAMEKRLDHLIQELSDQLYVLSNLESPDSSSIDSLHGEKLNAVLKRDSLVLVFEENYPNYYNLKHDDSVAECEEITKSIGRRENFVEYFLSDTILYTFIINRKGCELIKTQIDSTAKDIIRDFRSDIVNPLINEGTRAQFRRIVRNGNMLYNTLVEPVRPYMVSNRLIVSTDDILSYIPFEALVNDTLSLDSYNYREVNFLFKEFEIIYTYSASLMLESEGKGKSILNKALVFSPSYTGLENSDSILLSRQNLRGPLYNIPGAREEAIYISNLLGGQLFLDDQATERNFVEESSGNKVIHLAMHTLLNDKQPMLSKMIFTLDSDTIENGSLNTYEIYDLDLDAKMVVLSSCNTGTGFLQAGEGVISLARGFMYAGAPSVVMSLWEVDDGSASEIIKSFYLNLKHGYSKSGALRKARRKFLKESDMMRSHPYFWCTLVIMGDDEPIFFNRVRVVLILLLLLTAYYTRRKYYKPKSS
jgi:CHAT domain-containing protein/Tfp pilus assembly protein PilF